MTTPTPTDWLKYLRAQGNGALDYVTDWIAGSAEMPDDSAAMCEALDSIRALIDEPPLDNLDTCYSDGRPVWTQLKDPSFPLRWVWHPVPAHPRNQPQQLSGAAWDWDGKRRTVIVTAPGILDVVTVEKPELRLIEGDEPTAGA